MPEAAPDSRESPEDLRSRIATLEGDLKTKQQLEKDLAKEIKTKQQRVKTVKAETQGVKKEITRLRKTLRLSATSGIEEENARRLDKLPRDVWSKIFDHLEENDLFPAAMSCRFFRQKQKELVVRSKRNGPGSGKPRLVLRTNLTKKTFEPGPYSYSPTSLDYIEWLRKQPINIKGLNKKGNANIESQRTPLLKVLAALHGHLDFLVKHLDKKLKSKQGFRTLDKRIAMAAARNGQLHVLQWLQNAPGPEKGRKPVLEQECAEFAVHGHLDCLKCLRKHGCPFDRVAVMAASQGHTKVLQWLTGEGLLSMDPMICTGALTSGNLECCEYLRQSGFTFSSLAISAAAQCGNIHCLQWLKDTNQLVLDVHPCEGAANSGDLKTLQWLRDQGCPWDSYTWSTAFKNGHIETANWARANGCPGIPPVEDENSLRIHLAVHRNFVGDPFQGMNSRDAADQAMRNAYMFMQRALQSGEMQQDDTSASFFGLL